MEIFSKLVNFFTGATIAEKLQIGIDGWNKTVESVIGILSINPVSFKDGKAWASVLELHNYIIIIASSLLAVIILYRICKETLDLRRDLRLEEIAKVFIVFVIAEAMVVNSLKLTRYIFQIAVGLVGLIGNNYAPLTAPPTPEDADIGMLEGIVAIIICIAFFVLSFMLIYTVYFRFLKIFIIAPLASLAYATFAGGPELSRIGFSYLKTIAAYSFEVVLIILAINFGNILGSVSSAIWPDNMIWQMLEPLLHAGLVVGAARGAEMILRRTFGL